MNLVAESLPVDPAKTRKRPAVKASPRPPAEKQKLTLYVSTESAQRLAVHATMTGVDRSALIETLIREQLKRFVVQDRARPPAESLTVTEIGTESSV
jgi:Ribbon-helix-helix protein, copG family